MKLTVFGYKFRVEILLLCVLLLWFINANTFFSCAGGVKPGVKVLKEGFEAGAAEAKKVANVVEDEASKVVKKAKKAVVPAAAAMPAPAMPAPSMPAAVKK
jgi:hypothetical protein